jgi:hypothetical protein
MFKHTYSNRRRRVLLVVALAACLAYLALAILRPRMPDTVGPVRAESTSATPGSSGQENTQPKLEGEKAREYLEQTSEGQSQMEAMTAARFGLKWQECAPFDGESGGYLGMSAIRI